MKLISLRKVIKITFPLTFIWAEAFNGACIIHIPVRESNEQNTRGSSKDLMYITDIAKDSFK